MAHLRAEEGRVVGTCETAGALVEKGRHVVVDCLSVLSVAALVVKGNR